MRCTSGENLVNVPGDIAADGVDTPVVPGGAGPGGENHHAVPSVGVVGDAVVDAVRAAGVVEEAAAAVDILLVAERVALDERAGLLRGAGDAQGRLHHLHRLGGEHPQSLADAVAREDGHQLGQIGGGDGEAAGEEAARGPGGGGGESQGLLGADGALHPAAVVVEGGEKVGVADAPALKGGVDIQAAEDTPGHNVVHHLARSLLQGHAQHGEGVVIIAPGADGVGLDAAEAGAAGEPAPDLGVLPGHAVPRQKDGGGVGENGPQGDGGVGVIGISHPAAPVGPQVLVQVYHALLPKAHGPHGQRHLGQGGHPQFVVCRHGVAVFGCDKGAAGVVIGTELVAGGPAPGIGAGDRAALHHGHLDAHCAVLPRRGVHRGLDFFMMVPAGAGDGSDAAGGDFAGHALGLAIGQKTHQGLGELAPGDADVGAEGEARKAAENPGAHRPGQGRFGGVRRQGGVVKGLQVSG